MNDDADNNLKDFGTAVNQKSTVSKISDPSEVARGVEPPSAGEEDNDAFVQWTTNGRCFAATNKTVPSLPCGVYCIGSTQTGIVFIQEEIVIDDLISFEEGLARNIVNEIETFWSKALLFKKWGFLHRRGFLLYGPPGSGKTIIVHQVMHDIQERNGIVFMCDNPKLLEMGLTIFREIEPNRPVVCVFEDIDAIIRHYGESELLSVLDGESMVDKVLNIATTNYPEELDKRIVARPRRFDRVIKIGMPSYNIRKQYFVKKLGLKENKELNQWVDATEGFSFAAMSELVISVKCLDIPFDKAVEKLKNLFERKPTSDEYKKDGGSVGFGIKGSKEDDGI